ncbi:MAG: hypothetical protein H7A25_06085 [Leptospiraceae bacterium]|nr:hypothetical protein [Leptospiraceae bacterium]MCP5499452.1 hypothetical protein [Leptospiraceae bacterium]
MFDPIFFLYGLFISSYIPSFTDNYMPPPADERLGYYYYDNTSLFRYKKNTNLFDASQKKRNRFPIFLGNLKMTLYSTPLQSYTKLYEYKIICLSVYLCMDRDKQFYHKKGAVTAVELEHFSLVSSVNIIKYIYYGIPINSTENRTEIPLSELLQK